MQDVNPIDFSRIAQDLQIRKVQVESVVKLLDDGNTIPFIARYRQERTGGLGEDALRQIQHRANLQKQLADRKKTILRSIENHGVLTEDLQRSILKADTARRLEDLYLPFKPKKKSSATAARERGLEPLALAVWNRDPVIGNLDEVLPSMINPEKGLNGPDDVRNGVQQILVEMVHETADVRAAVRFGLWETGTLTSARNEKVSADKGSMYKDYFKFSEPARKIPPHRILALNRGEREGILKVRLEWDAERIKQKALEALANACLRQATTGTLPALTAIRATPAPASTRTPPGPDEGTSAVPQVASSDATAQTAPMDVDQGQAPEAAAPPANVEETLVAAGVPDGGVPGPEGFAPANPGEMAPPAEAANAPAPPPAAETPAGTESPAPEPAGDVPHTPAAEVPTGAAPADPVQAAHQESAAAPPISGETASLPPLVPANEGELLSPASEFRTPHAELLRKVLDDALNRLLLPNLEREIWRELMEEAEAHAIHVFACNLRGLLLQRPLHNRRVLAIDPGFRTGCRIAALDEQGNLLDQATIYPHASKKRGRGKDKGPSRQENKDQPPPEQPPAAAEPVPNPEANTPTETNTEPPAADPAQAGGPEAVPTDVMISALSGITEAPAETSPVPEPEAPQADPNAGGSEPAAADGVDKRVEAKTTIEDMVKKYGLHFVALGNGTGCRETEEFVSEVIAERLPALEYVIVNEAGVSYYSASPLGKEEFPGFDATLRGTISIGRRVQDPLAELVKVDPTHIGVGLYQHDVDPKRLKDALEAVVESSVNQVGVNLNKAGVPLLRHISGLNHMAARDLVEQRKVNGPFRNREQLASIPSVGQHRAVQAAGFVRITEGDNPLDMTWIHPESYDLTRQILAQVGCVPDMLSDPARRGELNAKLKALSPVELAKNLQIGEPTVRDILHALLHPGDDPREEQPLPVFRKSVLKLEDLKPGMELRGTVLNVVDFGAFVDIGLKDSGLIHISQLANRFVKNPYEVVSVGDVVTVWVLKVDADRHHVSLSMIRPGTERRARERRPEEGARPPQGERQPQGDRPPPGDRGPRRGPPRGRTGPPAGAPGGAPGGPPRSGGPRRDQGPRPGGRPGGGPSHRPPAEGAPTGGGPRSDDRSGPSRHQPPQPPRKPRREPPRPKLSKEALEGKEDLRSFGELSAFFAARKKGPQSPEDKHREPAAEGGNRQEPAQPPTEQPPAHAAAEPAAQAPEGASTNAAPPPAVSPQASSSEQRPETQPSQGAETVSPPAEGSFAGEHGGSTDAAGEPKEDVPASSAQGG